MTSKCTCTSRCATAHVRNSAYPHETSCYWYEKLRQEAQARADRDQVRTLGAHYRRDLKAGNV
jgi:hypothetical protein